MPVVNPIVDQETVKSLMTQMSEIEYSNDKSYVLDNQRVPRVTEILSAMLHEDSLMRWSNSLGFNRISYTKFLNEAAEKGTYVHECIARSLETRNFTVMIQEISGKDRYKSLNPRTIDTIYSCVSAFFKWWNFYSAIHREFEPVFSEETMICQMFGGTCDLVVKVDGKYWLVDFKTSKRMNFKFSIQLAAYKYLLRELKGIEIEKAIVLRLDKNSYEYDEYVLDFNIPEHAQFICDCEQLFIMLACAYRMRMYCLAEFNKVYDFSNREHTHRTDERKEHEREHADSCARL